MPVNDMRVHSAEQEREGPVRAEQIKLLFSALPLTLVLTCIISPPLVFLLWNVIDHTLLYLWLCAIFVVSLLRAWLVLAYHRASPEAKEFGHWLILLNIGTISAAIVWGATALLLFAEDSVAHQAIVMLIVGGVAAGSMTSLSPMLPASISFITISLLPLALRFLYNGTEQSIILGVLVLVFIVMVLLNSLRMNRNILQNIVLRLRSQENEKALKESEGRFRELFAGNRTVELIIDPDDGAIIEANRAAEHFYGYERKTLVSMKISDINTLSEEDVVAEMRRANKEKRNHFIFKHQLADGDIRTVEVHSGPILWNGKKVLYSIVHDITARKQAEERLRKLSQAVEQAGESVVITDREGIIEYVNPAFTKITGYTPDEAIGKTPRILKSGRQTKAFYEEMWKTITNGQVWQRSIVERRKDGTLYPATMSIAPIFNDANEITHYVGIQQDMTEQEGLENSFRQAQKMEAIGTLVGGIAHDFNNMLAGITGNVYLLKTAVDDMPDDEKEKLDNISALSFKAADMIKQLLTFARKGELEVAPFGLTSFISDVSTFSKSSIPENIHFQIDTCSEELVVRGDTTQLQQVLLNLLNNARDAVADVDEPRITLKLEKYQADDEFMAKHPECVSSSFALLTVTDNGCGISDGEREHIFEPFFTTKEVGRGTGLGLSMAYGAIQSQGGLIELESTLGEGSSFYIYLPRIEEKQLTVLKESQSEMILGKGELILICDDNADIRETVSDVLDKLGYRVMTAVNGLEAVELYKKHQKEIALIVMDVVMPILGGVKAVERIMQINPDVRVIFATGYDRDETLKSEMPSEEYEILSKPYSVGLLSTSIREQLEH